MLARHCPIVLSREWDVLGPFQLGTREFPWGADPLESVGGFHKLDICSDQTFHSAFGPSGQVQWSRTRALSLCSTELETTIQLTLGFEAIDWKLLQGVYGWAGWQYQAWVRGSILNTDKDPVTIAVFADHVVDLWLDEQRHYGGDLFAFRRSPLFVTLAPSSRHLLELRLVRDVRAMGAKGQPSIICEIFCKIQESHIAVRAEHRNFPDIVLTPNDLLRFPSSQASVLVGNSSSGDVEVLSISSLMHPVDILLTHEAPVRLAPGQTRPIRFIIAMLEQQGRGRLHLESRFRLVVRDIESSSHRIVDFSHRFEIRDIHRFHRFTFDHPSGVVSHCTLRAPPITAASTEEEYPVMVYLHGADVESDSEQIIESLDGTEDLLCWILVPQGLTSWGGDDWHQVGIADVQASLAAVRSWIRHVQVLQMRPRSDQLLVIGHSNGAQGAWYMATHFPDQVAALAVVSGYNSIQAYVPYSFWREADPQRLAVIQGVLADYRHELLVWNTSSMSILQQHAADDDNVPVYHSRRMAELIRQTRSVAKYHEITGGHWFDGIMVTKALLSFYRDHVVLQQPGEKFFANFDFVVANPSTMGTQMGLAVKELIEPGQLGKVSARFSDPGVAMIETSNVKRFSLSSRWEAIRELRIGERFSIQLPATSSFPITFERDDGRGWKATDDHTTFHLGGLSAILRTQRPLMILSQDKTTANISLQIALNLLQYFSMDASIVYESGEIHKRDCNVISIVSNGARPLLECAVNHPIHIRHAGQIDVEDSRGQTRSYFDQGHGLGAIFLRSRGVSSLELVVWGSDYESSLTAARLLPIMTGSGLPDFVIMDSSMMWRGVEGAMALGFFNSDWKASVTSFFS